MAEASTALKALTRRTPGLYFPEVKPTPVVVRRVQGSKPPGA
jgi:hypothetical protein